MLHTSNNTILSVEGWDCQIRAMDADIVGGAVDLMSIGDFFKNIIITTTNSDKENFVGGRIIYVKNYDGSITISY